MSAPLNCCCNRCNLTYLTQVWPRTAGVPVPRHKRARSALDVSQAPEAVVFQLGKPLGMIERFPRAGEDGGGDARILQAPILGSRGCRSNSGARHAVAARCAVSATPPSVSARLLRSSCRAGNGERSRRVRNRRNTSLKPSTSCVCRMARSLITGAQGISCLSCSRLADGLRRLENDRRKNSDLMQCEAPRCTPAVPGPWRAIV